MTGDQSCCLRCAVLNDDVEELKNLLDSCVLTDSQVWDLGCDLLRRSAIWPRRINKFLLERDAKADNDSKSDDPTTQFDYSFEMQISNIMYTQPGQRALDRLRSQDCLLPLRMAVQLGDTEVGEPLLDHICRRKTPSRCAVGINGLETIRSLLQVDANDRSYEGLVALKEATELVTQAISNLLSNRLDVNKPQLHIAAGTNDTSLLLTLLQQNADVEARLHDDLTPLHIAAQLGNTKAAAILLKHGADMNSMCASALCTLLDAAVRKGRTALVGLLLERAVLVNEKNEGRFLNLAATRNYRGVVKILLKKSIDVEDPDENIEIMLRRAVERRNLPLIEQIFEARTDLRKNWVDMQCNILEVLRRHGFKTQAFRHGLKIGSEDTKDIFLDYAIRSGYTRIVEYLLDVGINCNVDCKLTRDSTPLHTAIAHKRIEIARQLIENYADVNAKDGIGRTPLHYALHILSPDDPSIKDVIAMLLVSGARVDEPDEDGKTALQIAASLGSEDVVKLLLEQEADVNSVDERMETPLHSSARFGDPKTVTTLLNNGASVNARRKDGATALHIAVKRGQVEPVKRLIENGADVATSDRFGVTPLHVAVTCYNSKIVAMLLDTCEDVDCRDQNGSTALHFAARYGSFTFVRALLDHGADVNILGNGCLFHFLYPNNWNTGWEYHVTSDWYFFDDSWSESSRTWMQELDLDRESTLTSFLEHITKMAALGRGVNDRHLDTCGGRVYKDLKARCAGEVECLRRKEIGPTNVSYHDILTNTMNSLTSYARNNHIVRAFKRGLNKGMFPLYSDMLNQRFKDGQKRAGLLDSGLKSLSSLTGYALPDLLTIKLLGVLTDRDLNNLVKAGN